MSNAIGIIDALERDTAVDPTRSFCVSAPAGSGKTELLIQRYLALLATVQRPEQVLAITFTRKAAAEMRERVLQALEAAQSGEPCVSSHQQKTRELATQALAADTRHGWQLIRDINRMNIRTIDSFCGGLTRQMPILSRFGGQARVLDDAAELYSEAASELFRQLDEDHPVAPDLASLMLHFDNNRERLHNLLTAMLARRDQWQSYVGVHHSPDESEAYLLAAVTALLREALTPLAATLAPYAAELLTLQQFAATNLGLAIPVQAPAAIPGNVARWRSLRELLLTREGHWRQRVDKTIGFPADKGEPQQRKQQLQALIAELSVIDGLEQQLLATGSLPEMAVGDESWQLVLQLSHILPLLGAHLLLCFARHGAVDHSQVALSALEALGDDEAPTDLALRLDYQLEHILVDEFQDTAITQFELLRRLTRGWGQHNAENPQWPRTVMIVGDAMQSIYGFRDANVGLFLKARQEGFNGVDLEHLALRSNFRSDGGIVDWVNHTFVRAFPAEDDSSRGQVSFSAATAVRPTPEGAAVGMHAFEGESALDLEMAFICEQIALASADGNCKSVAVLGRSRGHLQPLIAGLKLRGIDYAAQDMDSLASSPLVADLLTLCRALVNQADRLAWMALLRAPWCGLTLADLLVIGRWGESPRYTPVYGILVSPQLRQQLSADGNNRLDHILPPLHRALRSRDRLALRVWLEGLWVDLGGPATAGDVSQLEDAERFFQLLEQAERDGPGLDPDWLESKLQKSYVNSPLPDCKVQIMTLHKAKGLEFDRVIIPQLGRTPRTQSRQILLWDEYYSAAGERQFLLAADDHSQSGAPTLYNFLQLRRQQKSLLETTRLLYVGVTRAIEQVLLTASLRRDGDNEHFNTPSRRSLLHPIWPTFEKHMTVHAQRPGPEAADPLPAASALVRLRRDALPSTPRPSSTDLSGLAANVPARPGNYWQRCVGNTVHLALEELSRGESLPTAIAGADRQRWRLALARSGLFGSALEQALEAVTRSVTMALSTGGVGRWILSSAHLQARSEWALTRVAADGQVQELIIDRSFVDAATGLRWLIDYKNSQPEAGQDLPAFLAQETAAYREQLWRYREVLRVLFTEPLRCALYFPALGQLHPVRELDLDAVE